MTLRPKPRRTAALPALPILLLGLLLPGCASDSGGSRTGSVTTELGEVTVSGEATAKPTVKVPTPFFAGATTKRVLTAGTGAQAKAGQRVTVQYLGINGTDGKQFDASWGRGPVSFVLDPKQYMPGLVTALTGVPVGSRVLVAVPPKDGYGVQGLPAAGIGPTDTLVVVVDLQSAHDVLSRAQGDPVAPKGGLPTVTLGQDGRPTITVPAGQPPASLVVQTLIAGKGAAVRKGQSVIVQYTGAIWASHKVFDSSWERGSPANFSIGVGKVIAGWDVGLVGQTVGSQVMLVIPPDQGYGAEGYDQAGIKGTDVLVFVIDILDAS
ncbi:MAG TPA: FKBP-type peptidyl-prolyl cis-trans isomerase [Kineosporiaceae bacterium]|nr:FKBP-type peptidyl-prolyl cis-trans isomerase [Kineosporiaceae bacterium]